MIERETMHSGSKLEKYTHLYLQYYDPVLEDAASISWCGANNDIIIFAYHAITITVHVVVRVDKYD